MKEAAIEKIRQSLEPEVHIHEIHEVRGQILAEVIQEYVLPNGGDGKDIPWRRSIRIVADKEGTILSHEGLF